MHFDKYRYSLKMKVSAIFSAMFAFLCRWMVAPKCDRFTYGVPLKKNNTRFDTKE